MSSQLPKLDLIYFKMRAFTEAIQMQLCYGKIPYNYYYDLNLPGVVLIYRIFVAPIGS